MKTPISLLWATPADAAMLASLHGTLFDTPWTTESFAAMADDPGSLLLVARTAGQPEPLAFIAGRVMADEAEILMLAVRAKALVDGRLAPSVDDVVALAEPVLKHRMALNFAARAEGRQIGAVIGRLAANVA